MANSHRQILKKSNNAPWPKDIFNNFIPKLSKIKDFREINSECYKFRFSCTYEGILVLTFFTLTTHILNVFTACDKRW